MCVKYVMASPIHLILDKEEGKCDLQFDAHKGVQRHHGFARLWSPMSKAFKDAMALYNFHPTVMSRQRRGQLFCDSLNTHPFSYFCLFWPLNYSLIFNNLLPGPSPRLGPVIKCSSFLSFFQRYIVRDISLTWDIAGSLILGVLAGSLTFYPPFWKARGMEDSQQKDV